MALEINSSPILSIGFNPSKPFPSIPPTIFDPISLRTTLSFQRASLLKETLPIASNSSNSAAHLFLSADKYFTPTITYRSPIFTFFSRLILGSIAIYALYQGIKFLKNQLYDLTIERVHPFQKATLFIPSSYHRPIGITLSQKMIQEEDPNAEILPPYAVPQDVVKREREREREKLSEDWVQRRNTPQPETHWPIKTGVPPRKGIERPIPENQGPIEND